jgi:hypothetical protein
MSDARTTRGMACTARRRSCVAILRIEIFLRVAARCFPIADALLDQPH